MPNNFKRLALAATWCVAAGLTSGSVAAQTTITYLTGGGPESIDEQLIAAFEAANPDINVEIEIRPGGGEGDNLVKTRLATGTMTDVFSYNTGSLFQALNPQNFIVDLSDEPWQASVQPSFQSVVTAPDGTIRGAPFGVAQGGGIFYNRAIYDQLGLSIPKTWGEFIANNDAIKAAGITPVLASFADTWTSQMIVLSDFYNVQSAVPNFAEQYTQGTAKFATTPAAARAFEKLQQLFDGGYWNEDFASLGYNDALQRLVNGEAAHYPMLTVATQGIFQGFPDKVNGVGFFAQPGDDAATNGLTVWMPHGLYISNTTGNLDAAKRFVAFIASKQGCDAIAEAGGAVGPFLINGCELPADVPQAVTDMLPYFEEGGHNAPALEFLSPIKGPALEQIAVEVGSGIRSAADAAALYDEDVRKQAQQLGLTGW